MAAEGRPFINMAGQRFGTLTAIARVENKGDSTMWSVRCDCGTEGVAYASCLRRGRTTSCGCAVNSRGARDFTGERVGRILVVESVGRRLWLCVCDCGKSFTASTGRLRQARSCGCLRKEMAAALGAQKAIHGESFFAQNTAEYGSWSGARGRCRNPNDKSYADYGGRGITVCERWNDYSAFLADMGRKPSDRHTLDRIDVNGNYEPSNCRWATKQEQGRNTRATILSIDLARQIREVYADGDFGTTEISKALGVSKAVIVGVISGRTWA